MTRVIGESLVNVWVLGDILDIYIYICICIYIWLVVLTILKNMKVNGKDISHILWIYGHMRTMVLEYESQHLPQKSPSFVGKYTSTMEHTGIAKGLYTNV